MKRPCAAAGCPNLVERGYCAQHARLSSKARAERERPSAHRRGYTRGWSAYSKARLRRYPLCVGYPEDVHGERVVQATVTDHIVGRQKAPELFWEPENHQSLCQDCNKRKGINEEGGFGCVRG